MRLMIVSDIHGDAESAEKMLQIFDKEKCEKILLLGDVLYHGPRNDLPKGYAPKKVIALLNENKEKLLCVRGNCDTEVDQMVLDFPILADYAYLSIGGINFIATHGHKYNLQTPPPMQKGDVLLNGHTHVPLVTSFGEDNLFVNPGSISLPKENSPKSYAVYDSGRIEIKDLSGEAFITYSLK